MKGTHLNALNRSIFVSLFLLLTSTISLFSQTEKAANPPIYIAFLWHMHQPIYWPYENVVTTHNTNKYPFNLLQIFNDRNGPYTNWPKDAVLQGVNNGMPHFGAQVSFSGSLIENLNNISAAGLGFNNWKSNWNTIKNQTTSLGNPRIDMVGFGYFHPLMGLTNYADIRRQIQAHKTMMSANFTGNYSKGIFPPENAFSTEMIPALKDEGLEWVMVDNIHFDRACNGYPFSTNGNLYEPNKADLRNADPADWVALNGIWAPTQNSALWGRQPHYVSHTDPNNGTVSKIIAVPTDRYLGNQDGQGGFGALSYDYVMSQLEPFNTNSNHPMLIVLHHDGDNYGGGSPAYYQNNFAAFVSWLQANPTRFVCTTVQDYLDMFPPDTNDIIHVEKGSWSGADNGDPEFKKWNADYNNCVSPDRNSWAAITAAQNYVATAQQIDSTQPGTVSAYNWLMCGEASDYWYWDNSLGGIWDSHPTRAANQAITLSQPVLQLGTDITGPSIWSPQREPYNPGKTEWNQMQSSDFTIWTYAFDVNGIQNISLEWRTDIDNVLSYENDIYTGGIGVNAWNTNAMNASYIQPQTIISPIAKAKEYSAKISGQGNTMIDYYIKCTDNFGNISKSEIQHVWVGPANTINHTWQNCDTSVVQSNPLPPGVSWQPAFPTTQDTITVYVGGANQGANLHWGVNQWQQVNNSYWPAGSTLFNNVGPAIESPMSAPDNWGNIQIKIGPFNKPVQSVNKVDFVIHYSNNTWDNNNGNDYHIPLMFVNNFDHLPDNGLNCTINYNINGSVLNLGINSQKYEKLTVCIYDVNGNCIVDSTPYEIKSGHTELGIKTNGLAEGIYFLKLKSNSVDFAKKFIVIRN
ncbi:MAG TPA: T9SS type A sorting domain-containing protein [Bacteroidia bacterium]|nr:T9SS type A sorting domain-containing protein [Bacteroidia bacterium]